MTRVKFTKIEDDFIRENLDKCLTLYELVELFNSAFPNHPITRSNLSQRMVKLKLQKGTHNIRKEKVKSVNALGTVILGSKGQKPRVKTEKGYVPANTYFKKLYYGENAEGILINLNGDKTDFSKENVVLVSKSIYSSLCWRSWFFTNPELTKAAILTAELLSFFPDLVHNENQYYRLHSE